jgi:hypothetical protein
VHAAHPAQLPFQPVQQRLVAGPQRGQHGARVIGSRGEVPAQGLGQGLDQCGDQLLAQPRHLPGEGRRVDLVQRGERHVHRHAVVSLARLERVGQRQGEPARGDVVGVGGPVDRVGLRGAQHLRGEVEQRRLPPRGALPPAVEVPPGHHLGRDQALVEVDQGLLVDHQVPPAGPVLQLLDVGEQLPVGVEEPVPGVPVTLDQGVPDEQLPGQLGVDSPEVDGPAGDDRDAVQGDPLGGHRRCPLAGPVRLRVGAADQVPGQRLDPLRVDPGHRAGEQPRGLHQLGGHHPARRLPGQRGTGEDHELGSAGAEVLAPAALAAAPRPVPGVALQQPDLAEQPGEHRDVDPVRVGGGALVRPHAGRAGGRPQLRVQVLPLPDAQIV